MRIISILSLFIILSLGSLAQDKLLKISDVYSNSEVYPIRVNNLQWIPEQNNYSFVKDNKMLRGVAKGGAGDKTILTLKKFNKDFTKAGFKETKRFPRFRWVKKDILAFHKNDSLYHYDIANGTIENKCYYPTGSEYIKANPKYSNKVAFTKGQNLFISDGTKTTAVTNDEKEGITNGQTVARSEFGITHGIFWSPKGNLLAYYHKDESMVGNYPLVNTTTRIATVEYTRYAMAGMTSEMVEVMVYNPNTGATIQLDNSKFKGYYHTNVTWGPEEKFIYTQEVNREQNNIWLNQYNAENGKFIKTILLEHNNKWAEPEEGIYFLNGSTTEFIFMSERDGFYHAYLCNTDGKIKQLTKGRWIITEFKGLNNDNSKMYFMGTKDSPLERHLYELDMQKLSVRNITHENGTHNLVLNADKTYAIDIWSNAKEIAREYSVVSIAKGGNVKTIKKNKNPLKDFKMGEMTIDVLKADDGTDLYYRLIKPANFEKGKKYPVIVYVYGGPHAQLIGNRFLGGAGYFLHALAAKGYVVFTLDNRGSGNRGFAFESVIHRQLGVIEMQDQMKGIEFLKTLDYVDADRIGVNGWSFGGFMTTSLMLNYPKTFKVGVAGGPVIDWKYYEIMYGERYMDTPDENPEGYERTSLLNKVENLEGQLLMIHGTMDPTVVWQHSQQFIKECVKKQKQVDYFIYPGHEHNVRGKDRLHLETKMAKYFDDYL